MSPHIVPGRLLVHRDSDTGPALVTVLDSRPDYSKGFAQWVLVLREGTVREVHSWELLTVEEWEADPSRKYSRRKVRRE